MRLGWRITDGLEFDLVGQDLLDNSHREFTLPSTNPGVVATDINRSFYGKADMAVLIRYLCAVLLLILSALPVRADE